jgi:membrane associated rhomboid family serine protease
LLPGGCEHERAARSGAASRWLAARPNRRLIGRVREIVARTGARWDQFRLIRGGSFAVDSVGSIGPAATWNNLRRNLAMLIPWNSSPPNYTGRPTTDYFPWATLGLIAANIAVFIATGMGSDESVTRWGLEYGNGLHPLQWVTRNFLHEGPVHLIGNMLFLWVFGLVIEGKLGWWKFLAVYLGLAVFQAGIEQSLSFWFDHGRSIGASGVIFALLAMALVWAPDHEIHCLWIYSGFFRWGAADVEISVLWMAIFYIGTNLFFTGIRGLGMSSELLHSLGAILGLALGFAMLKLRWVDCEGWDLLTVLSGGHLRSAARPRWFRRAGSRK